MFFLYPTIESGSSIALQQRPFWTDLSVLTASIASNPHDRNLRINKSL